MRLIFINRFYWPETPATGQLLTDLAESLARAGHHVTVVTSRPEGGEVPGREERHGVHIVRVGSTRWHESGLPGKAADLATFYVSAIWRLWRLANRQATVIAMTDPPLLGIGTWLVTRLRGSRLVHWIQDIYPEIAIELGNHRWLAALKPWRNAAWRGADCCVMPGEQMASNLVPAGVPPHRQVIVPNWAPVGLDPQPRSAGTRLREEWAGGGKFVVAYSGNLGRVHDLEPILDLAAMLADEPFAFVFVGAGAQRDALQQEAHRRGLHHVSFHPAQPRTTLAASLAAADVHLVTLRQGCERWVFPSKLYGIAAIGRPILFLGSPACEIASLVRGHQLGFAGDREDLAGAGAFLRAMRTNDALWARHAAATQEFALAHSFATAAASWRKLIEATDACGENPVEVTPLQDR